MMDSISNDIVEISMYIAGFVNGLMVPLFIYSITKPPDNQS